MMDYSSLGSGLVSLYRKVATDLPPDVEAALSNARYSDINSKAAGILEAVLENVKVARKTQRPICQDTGTPVFYVKHPASASTGRIEAEILNATRKATEVVPLRPNAVEPLSGVNSGNNIGVGIPVVHFEEWGKNKIRFDLMLKGGGSENATFLYRLPDAVLEAERDEDGIVKCVLDAAVKVQGTACSPNIIGVGVGGVADTSVELSKRQFFRMIYDVNPDKQLAALESELLKGVNFLRIGPMGLGGNTTALAVKVGKQHRHPASFFVAVSFMCWACRRWGFEVEC